MTVINYIDVHSIDANDRQYTTRYIAANIPSPTGGLSRGETYNELLVRVNNDIRTSPKLKDDIVSSLTSGRFDINNPEKKSRFRINIFLDKVLTPDLGPTEFTSGPNETFGEFISRVGNYITTDSVVDAIFSKTIPK